MNNAKEKIPAIGCTNRIAGNIIIYVWALPTDSLWTVGIGFPEDNMPSLYHAVHDITEYSIREAVAVANWHADGFMDSFDETIEAHHLICERCLKIKPATVSYMCEECFQATMELLSPRKPVKDTDLITNKNFSLNYDVDKFRGVRGIVRTSSVYDGQWIMILSNAEVTHTYYEPIVAPTRTEAINVMNRLINKYRAMSETEKEAYLNIPKYGKKENEQ